MKYLSIGFEQANLLNPKLPTICLRYKLDYTSQSKQEVSLGSCRTIRTDIVMDQPPPPSLRANLSPKGNCVTTRLECHPEEPQATKDPRSCLILLDATNCRDPSLRSG